MVGVRSRTLSHRRGWAVVLLCRVVTVVGKRRYITERSTHVVKRTRCEALK